MPTILAYLWAIAAGVSVAFQVGGVRSLALEFHKLRPLRSGHIYLSLVMVFPNSARALRGSYVQSKENLLLFSHDAPNKTFPGMLACFHSQIHGKFQVVPKLNGSIWGKAFGCPSESRQWNYEDKHKRPPPPPSQSPGGEHFACSQILLKTASTWAKAYGPIWAWSCMPPVCGENLVTLVAVLPNPASV